MAQHFLIKRKDGSVWVMIGADDVEIDPDVEIAKWPPEQQAEIIGHELA